MIAIQIEKENGRPLGIMVHGRMTEGNIDIQPGSLARVLKGLQYSISVRLVDMERGAFERYESAKLSSRLRQDYLMSKKWEIGQVLGIDTADIMIEVD